ncbi:hypothetical protein [Streptomyces sp. NPDC059009]|uniref:hypothetical protein n=1 Tax=Streptomyces sp. NPDC059009 TaxID=3346694 RepID=UPI0036816D6B
MLTDVGTAVRDIPLATLSAITHRNDPDAAAILKVLAAALKESDQDARGVYAEYTELGLGKTPAAKIWRQMMAVDLSFFRSETSMRLRAEGREEGRVKGLEEGLIKGRVEAVIRILDRRGIGLTTRERDRLMACDDLDTLDRWLDRAFTVESGAQLFAESEPESEPSPAGEADGGEGSAGDAS